MKWYTKEDGSLCLGTQANRFANFESVTEIILNQKFETPLLPEHAEIIGSFPEDWLADKEIDKKINQAAKHFFGLRNTSEGKSLA